MEISCRMYLLDRDDTLYRLPSAKFDQMLRDPKRCRLPDNQKNLSQAIVEFFDTATAFDFRHIAVQKHTSVEKDHGRIAKRAGHSWSPTTIAYPHDLPVDFHPYAESGTRITPLLR